MATSARPRLPALLLRLPERPLLMAAAAFALGLLVFVAVWLAVRGDDAPTGPAPPTAAAPVFEPLPAPMPAGSSAAPLPTSEETAGRLVEEPAPPPPPPQEPTAGEPLPAPIDAPVATAGAVQAPVLLPDQPAPRYPSSALRRGETGTVLLQVDVDALGHPVRVEVAGRSGSRALDRAATDAVRDWQFQPARDATGTAVPGSLTIPVEFNTR